MPGRDTIVHVRVPAKWPARIHKLRQETGHSSNTHYIQMAICEALSRDMGVPLEELINELPPHHGQRTVPFAGNPVTEVR